MDMNHPGLRYGKPEPSALTKKRREKREAQNERACREIVWARDKGRCRIPNCNERGRGNVEMHHIEPRSLASKRKWLPENNCLLCRSHHQLRHAGKIRISGDADQELIIDGDTDLLRFRL